MNKTSLYLEDQQPNTMKPIKTHKYSNKMTHLILQFYQSQRNQNNESQRDQIGNMMKIV